MSKIALVRTDAALPEEKALESVRAFLFGVVDGLGQDDKRGWRRFWQRLIRLAPGEMAQAEMVFPRNGKFLRKFFLLLQLGFDAWNPGRTHKTWKGVPVTKNFEQFREDVTIMAGFYEQTFGLSGRMKVKAKSISFAKMEEEEFEKVYSAVLDVLLAKVLTNYANREEVDRVVNKLMEFA